MRASLSTLVGGALAVLLGCARPQYQARPTVPRSVSAEPIPQERRRLKSVQLEQAVRALGKLVLDSGVRYFDSARLTVARGMHVYTVELLYGYDPSNLDHPYNSDNLNDNTLVITRLVRTRRGLESEGRIVDKGLDGLDTYGNEMDIIPGGYYRRLNDWVDAIMGEYLPSRQEKFAERIKREDYKLGRNGFGMTIYKLPFSGDKVPATEDGKKLRRVIYVSGSEEGLTRDDKFLFVFQDDQPPIRMQIDTPLHVVEESYIGDDKWGGEICRNTTSHGIGNPICSTRWRGIGTQFIYDGLGLKDATVKRTTGCDRSRDCL